MATLQKIPWHQAGLEAEVVGERCPKLVQAHDEAFCEAEFGVSWYEFVNTDQRVDGIVQEWWDQLPAEEQLVYLLQSQESLASRLKRVDAAVERVRG